VSRNSRLAVKRPIRSVARLMAENAITPALRSAVKPVASGVLVAGFLALAGCGNNYRPVISAISPVGPAAMTQKYAVVISNPNPPTLAAGQVPLPGIATIVDFSGDDVLITANIGVNPQYLILGSSGGEGYTINGDGTLSSFAVTTSLLSSQVAQTTLLPAAYSPTVCPLTPATNPSGTAPTLCLPTSIFPQGTYTYVTQPGPTATVAELSGTPPALQQNISDIGANPQFIAGVAGAPRIYSISTGSPLLNGAPVCTTGLGSVAAINTATNSVDSTTCVGANPVYGVMTATFQRTFIMNQGLTTGTTPLPGSVTVINSQQNTLDTGVPNGTISDPAAVAAGQGPVWADLAPSLNELVVANQGTSTTAGSVSIFSIPLCSTSALPTNTLCNPNNPVDGYGFGTLVAHIPVGIDPVMVAVLQDGSQAFVINKGSSTVSAINLTTDTVTATIPIPATPNPTFLAATTGTPLGKIYITSTTSPTMTIIRTDTDTVDTTVDLQGYGGQVRVTAP
jgi:YVTN family beta-propeller protein